MPKDKKMKSKKRASSPSKHPQTAVTPMAHTTNGQPTETKRMERAAYDHEKGGA